MVESMKLPTMYHHVGMNWYGRIAFIFVELHLFQSLHTTNLLTNIT